MLVADVVVEHRGDRVRLRDLLRLEALALEHVQEVGVAADVELHRAVEVHAAVAEERRQHAVGDRGADLRLDVVADDGHARLLEALLPVLLARDEDGHAVHHRHACVEDLLRVPLRRLLGADGEVVDDDVRAGVLEDPDDVVGLAGRLLDDLGEVLADAVVRHPARDRDTGLLHVGELDRVVRVRPHRVGEVDSDLPLDDVERGDELDVRDVVPAEVDVHEARDRVGRVGVLVVLDALDERVGAVADADDRDAHLVLLARAVLRAVRGGHAFLSAEGGARGRSPNGDVPRCCLRLLEKGTPSPSASARRTTSLTELLVRSASVSSACFSSSGTRRSTTGLAPGSGLRRPVGVYVTPRSSAIRTLATSLRLTPRRAVSRTSAFLTWPGIRTRTPRREVLAAKVIALYRIGHQRVARLERGAVPA